MNTTSSSSTQDQGLDHVLKYTGVFGGVQGLNILMSILRNKLATTLLGAAGIGLMRIYSSISEFVSSSTNFGIPFSSVRRSAELTEEADAEALRRFVLTVRTWCVWTAILSVLLCVGGAPLLGRLFEMDDSASIVLLAPMVAALSITGGEISILKGIHRLKRVALISAISSVTALCLTVPFFWAFGLQGILLALNASTLAIMVVHLCFSCPLYPWRIAPFSARVFREGWAMIRIGVPYVLAAVAGSGVTMSLLALMGKYGSQEDVGLYSIGYGLMVTYAGVVFTAIEADFFPRLSSVNHRRDLRNDAINKQIRACTLIMTPMLIAMMVAMPIIVPLLTSRDFLPVTSMAICASFYMFLRCISLPMAYTALACGHSVMYLAMELLYDAASLLIIVLAYIHWGVTGAGIGLSLSALFDVVLIGSVYGVYYHLRLSAPTVRLVLVQGTLLALALAVCQFIDGWQRYALGFLLFLVSTVRSYDVLARETTFISSIRKRLHL